MDQDIPQPNLLLLRGLMFLLRTIFRLYFRLECEGCTKFKDLAQRGQSLILVSNHSSNLDPPMLGVCAGVESTPIYFPGKREAFNHWLTGWLMRGLGGFPVDRETLDLSAARIIIRLIQSGHIVGIAPEGTRSRTGQVLPFKSGFVKLAIKTRTPVVPAGVSGTYDALPRGSVFPRPKKVTVRFGEPIDLASYASGKIKMTEKDYEDLAEMVRQRVIELCGAR
jgi:1-acyl-sn-glycerol-3-phosphate acyltransferase